MTQSATQFEPVLRESATFDRLTIQEIQRAAATGIYDIRGGGTKRHLPHFDDLLFRVRVCLVIRSKGIEKNVVPMWF